MSSLRIDEGSLGDLYVYRINEDGTDSLLCVRAVSDQGLDQLADTVREYFKPDMETCSQCLDEVPDATLTDLASGERVCQHCMKAVDPSEVDGYEPDDEENA